ncbi:MAG: pyrroline-5-carboxylate reductase, partial [Burkholderiales bacterium]|nr:pyrroline-5-carboxylate reductase [Burkholderiales bacterium]
VLRERVTSKGGTTFAALTVMQNQGVHASLVEAMEAAQERAKNLGRELGG